ncbi:hypothetical protein [Sporosarcina psychrophila]|uniref:Uncharacterized protein n=1 Tax=Sporosarcina psychrophila TaxID=1476 RepID=A0ABV2KBL7_SPOPS
MTKPKRTIAINSDYRLTFDDANVMIERLVTVDPTKAVNWAEKESEGADPTPRQEWRNTGKYYATIPQALTGLLEHSIRNGEAATLREVLVEIDAFRTHINGLLGAEV